MKYITWFIVASCIAMLYVHWGTPVVYGWIVAFTGWIPHLFTELKQERAAA